MVTHYYVGKQKHFQSSVQAVGYTIIKITIIIRKLQQYNWLFNASGIIPTF